MKKIIAIIFGGCSPEYPVSLQSAYSVITNMDQSRYALLLIGVTREGNWYTFSGSLDKLPENTWAEDSSCRPVSLSVNRKDHGFLLLDNSTTGTSYPNQSKSGTSYSSSSYSDTPYVSNVLRVDAVFPILHGKNGEDGTIQGACELAGIPVIGCQVLSSALCMHKELAHRIVESIGIRVPKSVTLARKTAWENTNDFLQCLSYPLFVKPMKAGSSFGITKVSDQKDLKEAVALALSYDTHAVVEETIDGFEVGCAVLEDGGVLLTGRVDEIELSSGFFDYTEKYTLKSSKIHLPARITQALEEKIKSHALQIYRALDCSGFARVDMFLTKDQEIVFNEVNTIPGFTAHSRYPGMLAKAGISYGQILNILIRQVIPDDECIYS